MNANNREPRERKEWEVGTVLKDSSDRFEVKVNVLRISRPLYSIQISGPAGSRFLRVTTEGRGKVSLVGVDTLALVTLINEAQAWILADAQTAEDEYISQAIEREAKRNPKQKEPRQTGKTEKNRNKHREKTA